MLENFNRNHLTDLLERNKNVFNVLKYYENLKVLLQTFKQKLLTHTSLDLSLKNDDIWGLKSNSKSSIDLQVPFKKIGREIRYIVMSNFYMELSFLLQDKIHTKAKKSNSLFRHIFVHVWFLMLQTFIDRYSFELW